MSGPNLSAWALRHRSFVLYLMIAVTVAGLLSYIRLGRSEDPAFTFRAMVVEAAWPGATLADTLDQITDRLERTLKEVPSLDFLRSTTVPGRTTIFVNLKGSTPPGKVPDIWYEVRKRVADMRHTLPAGVVGPGFNDDFGDTFGIIYGLTADGFTQRELRDRAEAIRKRLLAIPDVSKVEILGAQDERVFIEFSTATLAGLGLDRSAIIQALRAQNAVSPAGALQTGDETIVLRVSGAFESELDILDVNIAAGNRLVRLRDIVTVRRGLADPPQPMFRVSGTPAVGLAIAMREGGDILALGRDVKRLMAEITTDLPIGIEPVLVADQSAVVDTAIGEFMESLWQAIVIIMAVSIVSLGVRAGAVVALSIPLTLALVFPVMELISVDLQRISLGALIIALTLLVDDAMSTIDAMSMKLAEGATKAESAAFAYRTLAMPMLTGSFVTLAGFIPIGFARSSAGEYTFSIFAVVSVALIASWVVAVLFTPLVGVALLPTPKAATEPGRLVRIFRAGLIGAMRHRWTTIGVTLACFAASIAALPLIPRQFFPSSDRPELLVDLRLPQNASIHASADASARLDAILAADPDVAHWSTYVGRGVIRFYLPLDVQLRNDFFSQLVVVAKDVPGRERLRERLSKVLAEEFPSAVSRIVPLELGPPVGWPVQYRVSGPDLGMVREAAMRLATTIAADPRVRQINFDWMEPAREVRMRVDQDQARLLGLGSEQIAGVLASIVSGNVVTQMRDGIHLVDVVVRATDEQRVSLDTLRNLQVALPNGRTVPIGQLAVLEEAQEYPLIWRRDGLPTLTVQADVAAGVSPEALVAGLAATVARVQGGLPSGYRIATGGTVEESARSQASVFAVVPAMLFVTVTILMIQLQSFSRLALVLSVVPLGLIGIVAALLVAGKPLGFVAILGILALMGMIARNAVILIDQIETERGEGKSIWDAVIAASLSRLRPIVLTAISTVLGMIPIAATIFWGPMAYAIMGGLLVATVLTLIFLPALYVAAFRAEETAHPEAGPPRPAG